MTESYCPLIKQNAYKARDKNSGEEVDTMVGDKGQLQHRLYSQYTRSESPLQPTIHHKLHARKPRLYTHRHSARSASTSRTGTPLVTPKAKVFAASRFTGWRAAPSAPQMRLPALRTGSD